MSGASEGTSNTASRGTVSDTKDDSKPLQPQKPAAQLEEDDEFEDFPVEGAQEATNVSGSQGWKLTVSVAL